MDYDTPRETFECLRVCEADSEEYVEATSYLYEFIEKDVRLSSVDALNAARLLREGEVEEAEELVSEVL